MSDPASARRGRSVHMLLRRRASVASALAVAVAMAVPSTAGAAIQFRSATKASAVNASGAFVFRPSGLQKDDVMVATVTMAGQHLTMAPTGWTAIRTTTPTTSLQSVSFYRVATGSD